MDKEKAIILLAVGGFVMGAWSLFRRESEILALKECSRLMQALHDDWDFASIVKHLDEDYN